MALLRTTTLPIADIADEAGFGSPQAFNRIFKQKTGCTPRAYRISG
jgi:AraC-like DNA-binding protein